MTDRNGNHSFLDVMEVVVFIMIIPIIMLVVNILDLVRGER